MALSPTKVRQWCTSSQGGWRFTNTTNEYRHRGPSVPLSNEYHKTNVPVHTGVGILTTGNNRYAPMKPALRTTRIGTHGFAALVALLIAPAILTEAHGSAGTVWSAGMETGDLSEWGAGGGTGGGEYNSGGGDSWASQDRARTGQWSVKMVLPNGSGGTRLFRWDEGRQYAEAYYSAWFYFPDRLEPAVYLNPFQFKSNSSSGQSDPFWNFVVGNRSNGAMYLYLWDWQNSQSYGQNVIDIPVNQWVHFECFLKQSATGSGQLKCWQDGVLLWDRQNIITNYPNGPAQWAINNYSSGVTPVPTVIYADDAAISLTSTWPGH